MEAELRDKENLRREKDDIIRNLTDEKERQRETYERRINELDQTIKCKQTQIIDRYPVVRGLYWLVSCSQYLSCINGSIEIMMQAFLHSINLECRHQTRNNEKIQDNSIFISSIKFFRLALLNLLI